MMKRDHIRMVTIAQMFNEAVIRYGDLRCQMWKENGLVKTNTYSEVGWIVKDIACGLMALGVGKPDRICLMSPNSPQWLWADFSILSVGAVTTTIYPTSSVREMSYIINNSGAKMIFVRDQAGIDKTLAAVNSEEVPTLQKVIVMGDLQVPNHPAYISLQELMAIGKKYAARHPLEYEKRWRSVDMFDWCTIVYTSGTTGEPKGALHTHHSAAAANCLDYRLFAKNEYDFNEQHVQFCVLPLSHTYERQYGMFIAIDRGASIAYNQSANTLMEDFQSFKPHYMMSVPRIFERIWVAIRTQYSKTPESKALFDKALNIGLKVVDFHTDENGFLDMSWEKDYSEGLQEDLKQEFVWADEQVFSKVRQLLGGRFIVAVSASASLNPELVRSFLAMGIRIDEGYGLTETMNTTTYNNMKKVMPGSIGPFGPGVDGRLAEDGEIEVRGGNIFYEYFNNPRATAEAFTEDGYFKTGDIARYGPDNYVFIIDRKKAIIVLDTGKKVARGKVESQFSTSDWVLQTCAMGDDHPFVGALIVPKFDNFIALFQDQNITFDESQLVFAGEGKDRTCIQVGQDFIEQPILVEMITREIEEKNNSLERYEQIKKFALLPRTLTVDKDEITPTFKNKHRNIFKNFPEAVDKVYK